MRGGPADDGWVATVFTTVEDREHPGGIRLVAIEDETFNTRADADQWTVPWRRKGFVVEVKHDV